MTTLKIEPVLTKTRGGFEVEVNGLRLGTSDFLVGEITTPSGRFCVAWDANGTCRDQNDTANIDVSDEEIAELIAEATSLINPPS